MNVRRTKKSVIYRETYCTQCDWRLTTFSEESKMNHTRIYRAAKRHTHENNHIVKIQTLDSFDITKDN